MKRSVFILQTIVLVVVVVGPPHGRHYATAFTSLSSPSSSFLGKRTYSPHTLTPEIASAATTTVISDVKSSTSSLSPLSASNNDADHPIYSSSAPSSSSPLSSTGFLSHIMLKVPNVDETVDYWTSQGGKVRMSRPINDDNENTSATATATSTTEMSPPKLKSAFVEMGRSSSSTTTSSSSETPTFALEIVRMSSSSSASSTQQQDQQPPPLHFKVGNEICYIGLSKLLLFQNNLLSVITGEATKDNPENVQCEEPNGINVEFSASAPGDCFARICFRTNDLIATSDFYSNILGMNIKAQDDEMVCLRYENDTFPTKTLGVATTLVFDASTSPTTISSSSSDDKKNTPNKTSNTIERGDCFDHIAITTTSRIDELYNGLVISSKPPLDDGDESSSPSSLFRVDSTKIFMKPTDMFGKRVMGLIDPNGYKVVIAGR